MTWPMKRLSEVTQRIGGGTPARHEKSYWNGKLPWFTVADLLDIENIQSLSQSREGITKYGLENSAAKLVPAGAVVFSSRVVVGKVGIAVNDLTTNQDFSSFIPCEDLDPEFLAYFLIRVKSNLRGHQRGATIQGVTTKVLDSLEVPLPKKTEQRRIVGRIKECMGRLDEIVKLGVESRREREFLADSLIEAELDDLEGDDVAMSDVCSITSRLVDPRKFEYQKMLHVGGANIEAKTGRLLELRTAVEEGLKSSKFVFDASMVLYNKIRPYLKKVARPDFNGLCSADMYPLAPKSSRTTRDFLYYVLMSRRFTDYAIFGSNRAGMPKVNRDHLFAYRFTLPTLQMQNLITERLDAAIFSILRLGQEMSKSEEEACALREAILRKAFAGEL